jgi:hypothetical protein
VQELCRNDGAQSGQFAVTHTTVTAIMRSVTEAEKIPVAEFLKRNPRFKSTVVKAWCYGHRARLLDAGIARVAGHSLRVDEARLVAWLRTHGEAPKPVRKVGGLSVAALDGGKPPKLLPILAEPVPAHGRFLSVFEKLELGDWGLKPHGRAFRVAPTETPGEFSLWVVRPDQVRRLPYTLTFNGSTAGSWVTTADLPKPRNTRRKNLRA